jgi:hypothetical protein
MSVPESRVQRGHPLPSFEGQAQAFPEQERVGDVTALAIAIAEASTAAANYAAEHDLGILTYEVTRIRVVVAPNPGPTTYRAVLTPGG